MRTTERSLQGEPAGTERPDVWLDHVLFAQQRKDWVLARLVQHYDGYAVALARSVRPSRQADDDLDQIAREALLWALTRFDPGRGVPFEAFARPTIIGALRRHHRDQGWSIRIPRRIHEVAAADRWAADHLVGQLGREPTVGEVAECLGIAPERVLEARDATWARRHLSLDLPGGAGDVIRDQLAAEDPYPRSDDRTVLAQAIAALEPPARDLLHLYFYEECSQSQIAERYGVSQMQVSRELASVLGRLRARAA